MQPTIGFFSLLAIVISSQIGAGALHMPTVFAPLGISGLYSWIAVGFIVICLAIMFAKLSQSLPYTGGPHVYIRHVFGDQIAFFAGWLYWLVSWISTTMLLGECVGYINQVFRIQNNLLLTLLGLGIWIYFNYINLTGLRKTIVAEVALTIIKIAFFGFFIIMSVMYFDQTNMIPTSFTSSLFTAGLSGAMWCFIGIEAGTVPAESVHNPSRNIPRAIIIGTLIVLNMYICSIVGVMGLIPYEQLSNTAAPYALIAANLFGSSVGVLFALLVFFICASSLNTWILISGQAAYGLAQDKLLPDIFAELRNDIPYFGIVVSGIGVSLIWIMGTFFDLTQQMAFIIDATVPAFIIIYMMCSAAFIYINKHNILNVLLGCIVLVSCAAILVMSSCYVWLVNIALTLSGIPIYRSLHRK